MKRKKKFYIAGALKYESTRKYLDEIERTTKECGFETWSPYKDAGILSNEDLKDPQKVKEVLEKDVIAVHECDGAIFLIDGYYTGTIFELGYVYYYTRNVNKDFILIGLYTTVRGKATMDSMIKFCFEDRGVVLSSLDELKEYLLKLKGGEL